MAWQLLAAAAAPYVAKGIGQALNKPKEEDFKPNTKYMEKYLSHLKGITTNREAQHLAMQPALKTIGAESRKTKKELGYQAAKTGVSGSGIEAQMKLSAGQGTQQALADASANAAANQAAINRQTGEKIAEVNSNIEQEEERAAEAYKQAGKQWKQENINLGLEAVAGMATMGLNMSYENQQAKAFTSSVQGFEGQAGQLAEMGMSPKGIAQEAAKYQDTMSQIATSLAGERIIFDPYNTNMGDIEARAISQGFDIYRGNNSGGSGGEVQDPVAEPEVNVEQTGGEAKTPVPEVDVSSTGEKDGLLKKLFTRKKPKKPTEELTDDEENFGAIGDIGKLSPLDPIPEFGKPPESISNKDIFTKQQADSGMKGITLQKMLNMGFDPNQIAEDPVKKEVKTKKKSGNDVSQTIATLQRLGKSNEEIQRLMGNRAKAIAELGESGGKKKKVAPKSLDVKKLKLRGVDDDLFEMKKVKPKDVKEVKNESKDVKVEQIKTKTENSRTDDNRSSTLNRKYDRIVRSSKKSYDNYIKGNPNADIDEVTVLSNLDRDIGLEANLKNMTTKSLGKLPDSDKEIFISTSPKLEKTIDELVTQYKNKWGEEMKRKKKYPNWVGVLMNHMREGGKYASSGGEGVISYDIINKINYIMGRDYKNGNKELNGDFLYYLSFKYDLWRQ